MGGLSLKTFVVVLETSLVSRIASTEAPGLLGIVHPTSSALVGFKSNECLYTEETDIMVAKATRAFVT